MTGTKARPEISQISIYTENSDFFDDESLPPFDPLDLELYTTTDEVHIESEGFLNILSFNICSLNAKIDKLKLLINSFIERGALIHIIAIQESWIIKEHERNFLKLDGYELVYLNRKKGRGGGVAFFFHQKLDW